MIIYSKKYEDDWVVLSHINYALKKGKYGKHSYALEEHKGLAVPNGEKIALCGHGCSGQFSRYGANEFVRLLSEFGLKQNGCYELDYLSCIAAGTDDSGTSMLSATFDTFPRSVVSGACGPSLCAASTGHRVVVWPGEPGLHYYNNIEKPYLLQNGYTDDRGWIAASELWGDFLNDLTIFERADFVGEKIDSVYGELAELGKEYLFEAGRGIVTLQ